MNPTAIVFWLFSAGLGFLAGGQHGAIVGVTTALGLSFIAGVIRK